MLISKKEYVMTGEITPEIGRENVWDYIHAQFSKEEYFDILVPEEVAPSYIRMQNLVVLGKYADGDAVVQCEPVILCFDSQTLYTNQENCYPEQEWFDKVVDIYSYQQFKQAGFPMKVGIPSSLPTAYGK